MDAKLPKAQDSELLKLDNQLCFRLYAVSRAITSSYRPLLDKLGLTYPQYLVLLAMWQWDEEGVLKGKTLKELIARLRLDSGTMAPLYRRMEQAGLVSRSTNARDKRSSLINLTAKGRKLKKRAVAVPQQLQCQFLNDGDDLSFYHDLMSHTDYLLDKLEDNNVTPEK